MQAASASQYGRSGGGARQPAATDRWQRETRQAGSSVARRGQAVPPSPPATAPSAAHRVPIDVLIHILTDYATLSPTCALNAMLVSKPITPLIEQGVLHCVSLFSVRGMESFHQHLKRKPERGRRVKALWIAPVRQESDMIAALAPPTSSSAAEVRQRKVQTLAREILRACRRIDHLALDGGFLTPQSAVGFGTACKPRTLLCVNPHSFLGHFSAPLFRTTVRRLEVVDTTLAVEEVDEIRQMQALRHFVWTSPRAKADVTRDVSVLLRILSPRARDLGGAAIATEADEQQRPSVLDQSFLDALASSGTAPPEKARRNEQLQSICTATSQARAAALAATFRKIVESVEAGAGAGGGGERAQLAGSAADDEDDDELTHAMRSVKLAGALYVDSARANSSALHRPSGVELQTRALSSLMRAMTVATQHRDGGASPNADEEDDEDDDEVVDEWEALRDVVCQRRTANATTSSRYFAGLSSGPPTVHNSGTSTPVGAAPSYAGSSVGWATSRASSPTGRRAPQTGSGSGPGSGAQTPAGGAAAAAAEEIDGGRALQRVWRRWRMQVLTSELDLYL